MKYLIMSDSHGDRDILRELITKYENQVDLMFHCGDSELAKDDELIEKLIYVKGNVDFDNYEENKVINNQKQRFFLTHGHLYGVNFDLTKLILKAQELQANICLYGHTHVPLVEYDEHNDLLVINPGSISQPRIYPPIATYVILTVTETNYQVDYYNREHQRINQLSRTLTKK